jgi:tRNA threonylcarbamoyladenosine biosynthesis protein TsaB
MNILAIDTSSPITTLAVKNDFNGKVFAENVILGRELSSKLIKLIKKVLKKSKLELKNVDAFVVGEGPGSFTSLRIGFATIFGLNLGLDRPVINVSSLDVIAGNVSCNTSKTVCVIVDARRDLLYSCIYKAIGTSLKRISKPVLIEPDKLKTMLEKDCLVLGDGLKVYHDKFNNFNLVGQDFWYPKSEVLLEIGLKQIKKFGLNKFHSKVLPLYLYPKDCQVRK